MWSVRSLNLMRRLSLPNKEFGMKKTAGQIAKDALAASGISQKKLADKMGLLVVITEDQILDLLNKLKAENNHMKQILINNKLI